MKNKIFVIDAEIKSTASAEFMKPDLITDLTSVTNTLQENFLCETVEDAIKSYLVNFFNNSKVAKHAIVPGTCTIFSPKVEKKGIAEIEIRLDTLYDELSNEYVWLKISAGENETLLF